MVPPPGVLVSLMEDRWSFGDAQRNAVGLILISEWVPTSGQLGRSRPSARPNLPDSICQYSSLA